LATDSEQIQGNTKRSELADEKNGFRFRFPFPIEDGTEPGRFEDFDRGVLVNLTEGTKDLCDMDHGRVYMRFKAKCPSIEFNLNAPCPMSGTEESRKFYKDHGSRGAGRPALEIVQQKQVEGLLWLVIRCPYCGNKARLPEAKASRLACFIMAEYGVPELRYNPETQEHEEHTSRSDYWQEIASRIMLGYNQAELENVFAGKLD